MTDEFDHVLIKASQWNGEAGLVYHTPSADDPDTPACPAGGRADTEWRRQEAASLPQYDHCKACRGDVDRTGGDRTVYDIARGMDPEQAGLEPWPPNYDDQEVCRDV